MTRSRIPGLPGFRNLPILGKSGTIPGLPLPELPLAHALAALPRTDAIERLRRELPTVSASKLVAGMQKVTSAVQAHGAVVITRHDEPAMVLVSIDRYLKLEQAAEPNLDVLTQQFDTMLAQMQQPQAAERMEQAFGMTPAELGAAARRAARSGSSG